MSLLDPLRELHDKLANGIQANPQQSGLGQIRFGLQRVSLIRENGHYHIWGMVPDKMRIDDVIGAIIDDLVDDDINKNAMASKNGFISRADFLNRAEYYENRYAFPTLKDRRFAEAIRTYAAQWPA